jgi:hypothetical protein
LRFDGIVGKLTSSSFGSNTFSLVTGPDPFALPRQIVHFDQSLCLTCSRINCQLESPREDCVIWSCLPENKGRYVMEVDLFQTGFFPVRYSETRHAEVAKRTFRRIDHDLTSKKISLCSGMAAATYSQYRTCHSVPCCSIAATSVAKKKWRIHKACDSLSPVEIGQGVIGHRSFDCGFYVL